MTKEPETVRVAVRCTVCGLKRIIDMPLTPPYPRHDTDDHSGFLEVLDDDVE